MPVEPPAPKHRTQDLGDILVISMPSLKVWPLILVFSIWSFMWVAIEVGTIAAAFTSTPSGILSWSIFIVWFIFWTSIGTFLLYFLAWQLFGKEEIRITNDSIKISRMVFGLKNSKEYLSEHIRELGLARVSARDLIGFGRQMTVWSYNQGSVSFDYGSKTFKFGASIDEAEAKQIVAEIQQRYPQYRSNGFSHS